jgi:hypothetical protein
MSLDPYFDSAPLAALGVLDGDEARRFALHAAGCLVCRREQAQFQRLVALVPLELDEVPTPVALRARVLAAAGVRPAPAVSDPRPQPARRPAPGPAWVGRAWAPWLGLAASVLLALGLAVALAQRNAARREATQARALAEQLGARASADREQWQAALEQERRLRLLLGQAEARVARLEGRAAAPQARARVVWSPISREALLIADGLAQAPAGRTYQLWVIADAAPAPAGTFDVDVAGRALVRTHEVEATEHVRTFAVTLEPAGGRAAPSGPMVLAGNVS